MKKLFIALMLLLTVQLGAQTKDVADALRAYERAKSSAENERRASAPKTWTDLASAYTQVYDAPIKSIWLGASQMEVKVLMKDQRIEKSDQVEIGGVPFFVDHYSDKRLYYSADGELAAWEVTKQFIDKDPLKEAMIALEKAISVDSRGRSTKTIYELMEGIKNRYFNEAMSTYTLGKFVESSKFFEKAATIGAHEVIGETDTVLIYYAGLTAFMGQDHDRAISFFQKSIDLGYDAEGDAYSYMAESYKAKSDVDMAKQVLNDGFRKYPGTQSILVSLINTYLETNDDPEQILDLIHIAQQNEPNNATLYYAEGNVWKNLDNIEKAVESYKKSVEIDETYYFGYFAIGAAYYDRAVDLQVKAADEMDDPKYDKLIEQLEDSLLAAIDPFEKCYDASDDEEIKLVVAEYLKNIYFRFREKNEEFLAGYEKYNAISHRND